MDEILKYVDNPIVLGAAYVLWKVIEKLIDNWKEWRSKKRPDNYFSEALDHLVLETTAEYNADKAFVIYHDDEDKCYSIIHEHSPRIVPIGKDYQRVPYDNKARWAMDKLNKERRVICHSLEEVEHEKHRSSMEYLGMNSWYCFALSKNGGIIGSLNLYYKKEGGLDEIALDSFTGKLSTMGNLLHKEMNE